MEVLHENDSFIVKKSNIDGAGYGLFSKKAFKKGDKVVKLTGKRCTPSDPYYNPFHRYALEINRKGDYIDPCEVVNQCDYGMYANDANKNKKKHHFKNNVYFSYMPCRQDNGLYYVWMKAKQNIRPGDEIFVSYGKKYWNCVGDSI